MARQEKLTATQIIEALRETNGLPALAAERLGVVTKTIYNYRDRYPSVADAMHHQKERRKDIAEGQLWRLINDLDTAAVIFYLKTQAKDRGYVERQELTGAEGGPLQTVAQWKREREASHRQAAETMAAFAQEMDDA